MDDLRSEIRAAFQREQMANPPSANLRYNIVRSVAARPRREVNLQWLAFAAAVVIGILVVVSLMSTRLAGRPIVPSHPGGDYGPPPAGVHLIYVADPEHDGWFIGFDWTGQPRGTVKLATPPTGALMAPDGQSFGVGVNAKGGSWQFLDRLGQPAGSGSLPGAYSPMWADDNQHLCAMTVDQSFVYTLWTELPGQNARSVVQVARDSGPGQTTVGLAACSFRSDRALAVRTTDGTPSELWVIRLSDGNVLAHHAYPSSALSSVVASSDARYVAESSWYANGGSPASGARISPPAQTQIRRVDDWTVLAGMDGNYSVLSFSGDGTRVLVRTEVTQQGTPSHLAIFKWDEAGTMTTIWHYQVSEQLATSTAEPGGDSFAFGFVQPGDQATEWCAPGAPACAHLQGILIVHGDGSTVQLPARYNPTW